MRALLLVDLQNDFMPGGSLPCKEGDAVVPVANALMPAFTLVVATQDWHPADHGSFASNHPGAKPGDVGELAGVPQVYWPDHCVQDSWGARFNADLRVQDIDKVVHKGTDASIDSYSTFYDNARRKETELDAYLKANLVDEIVIMGLATDYCVLYSCRDGLELGYAVTLVEDGCRPVDLHPGDGQRAIDELRTDGVAIATSGAILAAPA